MLDQGVITVRATAGALGRGLRVRMTPRVGHLSCRFVGVRWGGDAHRRRPRYRAHNCRTFYTPTLAIGCNEKERKGVRSCYHYFIWRTCTKRVHATSSSSWFSRHQQKLIKFSNQFFGALCKCTKGSCHELTSWIYCHQQRLFHSYFSHFHSFLVSL